MNIRYLLLATLLPCYLATPLTYGATHDPPVSARATGLGYAGATIHENGFASYWNPAILPRLGSWNVALTQAKVGGDTQLYYAGFSYPLRDSLAFAFSWSNLVITDQGKTAILRDESGRIIVDPYTGKPKEVIVGFYDESDNVVGLGLGIGKEQFSIGGTVKLVYNLFSSDKAIGVGGDAGVAMRVGRLNLGVAAKNIGDVVVDWKHANDESHKALLRTDAGLEVYEGNKAGVDMVYTAFVGGYFDRDEGRADYGLECGLMNLVYLRMGTQGDTFCSGLGFEFERLMVDYAFTQSEEFYSSHRISVELRGEAGGGKREAGTSDEQSEASVGEDHRVLPRAKGAAQKHQEIENEAQNVVEESEGENE